MEELAMNVQLTTMEAYAAMYAYLEIFYARTKSDDVGGLLGSMSLLADGSTADPAILKEWAECIRRVKNNEISITL
jgi:hypothetical protein